MRFLSTILLGLVLIAPTTAWGVAISDIQFEPSPVAALQFDQDVDITFQYDVELPLGVRIFARPITEGELTPNYAASGSPLYIANGMGDADFTITTGEVTVDAVRFQVWTHDQTDLLLEFYVPVIFHYGHHGIYHIMMTPESPSCVMYDPQEVELYFDYITDHPGDVRIFARPYTDGGLTPNYGASGSPAYPSGMGNGDQWFKILSPPEVEVDQIRFWMTNEDQSETLLEFFVPVSFEFKAGSVYNISFMPLSPEGFLHDEQVNIDFHYWTTDPDGVRIWARPFTDGSLTPGYAAHASPLYPTGNGVGTGYFTVLAGEVTVDQVRFQMYNEDESELICEYFVPVNFHFAEHAMRDIWPMYVSPAYFTYDHDAMMQVPYSTSWQPGVRIWAQPYSQGSYTPDGYYGGSVVWPTGDGIAVDRYVGARSGPVLIDEVWLLMRDPDQVYDLASWLVEVELYYGGRPSSAVPPSPQPVSRTVRFANFENPMQANTQIIYALEAASDVTLKLLDVEGRVVCSLVDQAQPPGEYSVGMPRSGIHSGVYFLRLEAFDRASGERQTEGRRVVLLD